MLEQYTRILGQKTFGSQLSSVISHLFFGWTPENEEAGITDWDDDVLEKQVQSVIVAITKGATTVEEVKANLERGDRLPALVEEVSNSEVLALGIFLQSLERLNDPVPCVVLEDSVLKQELSAYTIFAGIEVGMPCFEWDKYLKTEADRAQDLICRLVNCLSIAV